MIPLLVFGNALTASVALYYCICAINAMDARTRQVIRWCCIGKGVGLFAQMLAAIDYLVHANPLTWPWLLLTGFVVANASTALLYLSNRRDCACPGCPARRACPVPPVQ